ncbi:MAG TPA: RNA pseudouridine synthase, partial [Spirochaetales bacterium]|nr:RNA pseudouridine synthase [Spirochaetales bacterium]
PKGRAALVHRLDRDTSGIMIFAKNAKTKSILMRNWNTLVQKRCYIALVEGTLPQDSGTIDTWLVERNAQKVQQVPPHTRKALRAITHYRRLQSVPGFCLVELELETGRRHQIRVQMAGIGCPIAGDYLYGAQTNPFNRLCLHAYLLVFIHPYTKQLVTLTSTEHDFNLSG